MLIVAEASAVVIMLKLSGQEQGLCHDDKDRSARG
jgi:hypothetical protein